MEKYAEKTARFGEAKLRVLPETAAGGYSRHDGTVEFYQRVNALIADDSVVVDLGAGRGRFAEEPVGIRRELQGIRGRVGRLVGLDVDPVVLQNPTVDEAHIINAGEPFALADESVDVVVSDFTFEHIDNPSWIATELHRILRPSGWICARTPNRWGTIALPARMVPNSLHTSVLRKVQPTKKTHDTFPTRYRLNDTAALRRYFPPEEFVHCSYTHDAEPAYVGESIAAWKLVRAISAVTPPPLRSMLMVFLQKR